MGLSVCGFNHKTASIEDREPFQLGRAELTQAVEVYKDLSGCEETVIVTTCNRMEFYQFTPDKCDQLPQVIKFYTERGVPNAEKLPMLRNCDKSVTAARKPRWPGIFSVWPRGWIPWCWARIRSSIN